MKGSKGILVLGLLMILASTTLVWYVGGGAGTPLTLDDPKVQAAKTALMDDIYDRDLVRDGTIEKAWLGGGANGYSVHLITRLRGYPWHVIVVFSSDGAPLEHSSRLADGLSHFLQNAGIALIAFWFVAAQLLPRVFWPKCPDCPATLMKPLYLETTESSVYTGGFDDDNVALPPIMRRDQVCPQCGYHRVTYFVPSHTRAGAIMRPFILIGPLPRHQGEKVMRMLDEWFLNNPKRTRFHNIQEWRAYYDELKASEREERPVARH